MAKIIPNLLDLFFGDLEEDVDQGDLEKDVDQDDLDKDFDQEITPMRHFDGQGQCTRSSNNKTNHKKKDRPGLSGRKEQSSRTIPQQSQSDPNPKPNPKKKDQPGLSGKNEQPSTKIPKYDWAMSLKLPKGWKYKILPRKVGRKKQIWFLSPQVSKT